MRACKSKYLSQISRGVHFFYVSPLISVDVPYSSVTQMYSFVISQAPPSKLNITAKETGR